MNYAFIDSQNLNLGVQELGWRLDWKKFRIYLKHKYKVERAYLFIGFVEDNGNMYRLLQSYGFILVFKPTLKDGKGNIKGNVDADLVLRAMVDKEEYDQAIIVTSDGDFYCLVEYLYGNNKLRCVISPCKKYCSTLLQRAAKEKIHYMDNLCKKLQYLK
ncbi:TPA: hypothetical protein DF272_05795 [Candidatus Falkowbacteria bacterium]|nr:hypothetical protein [Candidatus Falkowbacteria bacterium]